MAKTLQEIMSTDLVTVQPDTSIQEVARLMQERDIGNVLVTEGDRLTGMVTDRDLVVRALTGSVSPSAGVREYMTTNLLTCPPDTSIEDAAQQMAERQVRRLPVVDPSGRPVGIVSLGDLAVRTDTQADEAALELISEPDNRDQQGG